MKLDIESGGKRWQVGLPEGSLFIKVGSAADCDVKIPDASSMHAKFENFMGKWTVTDQMSDTGTKLNGETAYSAELKPGDLIEIGSAKIRILAGEGGMPRKFQSTAAAAVPMDAPPGLEFKTDSLQEMISKAEPVTLREATPAEFQAAMVLEGRATQRPEKPKAQRPVEKTPQERFADELAGQPDQTNRSQAPVYQMQAAQAKKASPVVGVIIMGAILLCVAGIVIETIMDESSSPNWEDNSLRSNTVPRASTAEPSRKLSATEERFVQAKLDRLKTSTDAWEVRLAALDRIVDDLKKVQHNLDSAITGLRYTLERGLVDEMAKRSSKDQTEIYDLVENDLYGEAIKRLVALRDYAAKTTYHVKFAQTTGIKDYIAEKIPEVDARNLEFINEKLYEADSALERRDYAQARLLLTEITEKANVTEVFRTCAKVELANDVRFAQEQVDGKREAPVPVFDKRKSKLPAAPKSTLLPDGENSRWKYINALNFKLTKAANTNQLKGQFAKFVGYEAEVGEAENNQITLVYRRVMKNDKGIKQEFTITLKRRAADLPAATLLSFFEQYEKPTRDEYLGMLLFCFENGLMNEAPRMAFKLWKADESVKPDLDKLLATKLGIEVPEGGFIERNGRLEPK
jgi:FlaG/FlaF family flagellin (archaellin)